MSTYDSNEDLAKAFKYAIKNAAARAQLINDCSELKSVLAFYKKNESYINQNSSSNKYAHLVLKALKENICFQLQEEGPTSFDDVAKVKF